MNNREIVADNLTKKYKDFYAVNGVSFKVNSGEIYGFLGPNGAGKSTCVSMMTTLILPTSGKATVVVTMWSLKRVKCVAMRV